MSRSSLQGIIIKFRVFGSLSFATKVELTPLFIMSEVIEESKDNAVGLGTSIEGAGDEYANKGRARILSVPAKPSARMSEKKEEAEGRVMRSTSSPSLLPTSSSESVRARVPLDRLPALLEANSNLPPVTSDDAKKTKRSAKNDVKSNINDAAPKAVVQTSKEQLVTVEADQVHQSLENKIMKDLGTSMQASKMESASKTPSKAQSNTVGAISTAKPDPTEKKDLLSRFKSQGRRYEQVDQHSPKKEMTMQPKVMIKGGKKKSINNALAQKECTIQNIDHFSHLKTPESQRPIDQSNDEDLPFVRSIGLSPLMLDIFRIFTILFSAASIASGACTAFDGKTSFINSITDIPLMWIVRVFIAWFHLVLIVVELDIEVRGLIPKNTFGNFLHKGYLITFIGLLQSFPSAAMSLDDVVNELQNGSLSTRGIQIRVAFAVLGVCSKGLIACGIVYMLLGICGWNGESRRRAFKARHFSR